ARHPPNWDAWAAVIYGGLVGILPGNIVWFRGIHQASVDKIMVDQYLPPAMTLAIVAALLAERLSWRQAIGSMLVLLGVAVVQRSGPRKPVPEIEPSPA